MTSSSLPSYHIQMGTSPSVNGFDKSSNNQLNILQRRKRALYTLLALYEHPTPASAYRHYDWERILGMPYAQAIEWLLTRELLRPIGRLQLLLQFPSYLRKFPSLPDDVMVMTDKGRARVRKYQETLYAESYRARQVFDEALSRSDIAESIAVAQELYQQQIFPENQLWSGLEAPSKIARQTTDIILQAKLPELPDVSEHEEQALRFLAAELALGFSGWDRSDQLPQPLHSAGNLRLAAKIAIVAMKKAIQNIGGKAQLLDPEVYIESNLQRRTYPTLDIQWIENARAAEQSLETGKQYTGWDARLPKVRYSLRSKIILPYVLLSIMLAVAGALVISQIIVDSVEERFLNQLVEAGKVVSDRMVVEENARLNTLRLLTNIDGFEEAVADRDIQTLRSLILPVAANAREEAIEILDMSGSSIFSMRHRTGGSLEDYIYTQGGREFANWDIAQRVLQGEADQGRDKHAGIFLNESAGYFFVAGPIVDETGTQIGALLVGKTLPTIASQFRSDSLAQTTLYDMQGHPLASTFAIETTENTLGDDEMNNLLSEQDESSVIRPLNVGSILYQELVGVWEIRSGTDIGFLGTALPRSFVTVASDVTRLQLVGLLTVGLLVIIGLGTFIARQVTKPLMSIMGAANRVAHGNLETRVAPQGNDEIAVLAYTFNQMIDGLKEVTESRMREVQLVAEVESEKSLHDLKSRFISMASHEFRNPLATILSSSQYLSRYGFKVRQEKREKHFRRIDSAVKHMNQLLEDVLVIGKTESGRLDFHPEPVNLEAYCEDIVEEMRLNAGVTHQIVFTRQVVEDTVDIDRKLMRLVLANLLSNAIKYSPDGGVVRLALRETKNRVTLRVSDQGIGIPEEDQKRLFTAFHRANNVENIAGTGLGLYITKMVVEMHHGTIEVHSVANKGTTFSVTIPRRQGTSA